MKTMEKPVFDEHQVANELGYTEEQIQQFEDLFSVLNYWSDEMGARRASVSDMPKINDELYSDYCDYNEKINDKKVEFYFKYQHLL